MEHYTLGHMADCWRHDPCGMLGCHVQLTFHMPEIPVKRLLLIVALLTFGACARATMPTVEEGWVPLDEWNSRIVAAPTPRSDAAVAEYFQNAGLGSRSTTVRTYCHSHKRVTHCSSYAW